MLKSKQSFLVVVLLGFLLNGCDSVRRFRAPNTHRAVVKLPPAYTIGIIVMMVVIGLCLFTCRFLFPNGMEFTALDLDEIRLERLSSIESRIRRNIRDLKSKLSFHKDKRKKVERERNMKIQLQGFLNNTNNNSHKNNEDRIYDQENFPSPDKTKRKRTAADPLEERLPLIVRDNETGFLRGEGKGKEEEEEKQEEEKEDLWQLWNKMATHQKGNNNNNTNNSTATEGVGGGTGNPLYKSIKYENKAGKKSAPFLSMAVPSEMSESKQAEQRGEGERGDGGGGLSREFNQLPGPGSKKTSATPIEVSSFLFLLLYQ
jgi:hypothetical protein